jgi:hypothetical protein
MDGWKHRLQGNLACCEAAILLLMAGIAAGKIALQPAIPAIHCKIVLAELRPSKCSSVLTQGTKVLSSSDQTKQNWLSVVSTAHG